VAGNSYRMMYNGFFQITFPIFHIIGNSHADTLIPACGLIFVQGIAYGIVIHDKTMPRMALLILDDITFKQLMSLLPPTHILILTRYNRAIQPMPLHRLRWFHCCIRHTDRQRFWFVAYGCPSEIGHPIFSIVGVESVIPSPFGIHQGVIPGTLFTVPSIALFF